MSEEQQGRSAGGGRPPGRRGAKPCRLCGAYHWQTYEETLGSGVWYARVWFRGRPVKRKVGPHGLALKVAAKWKVEIAEGRFFPSAITPSDEVLSDAIAAYRDRRTEQLGADGLRILKRWEESREVRGKTVRDFNTEDAERFLQRRQDAGRCAPSTRNKDVSYLFTFFEDYEDHRRRDRKRAQEPPIANPMKGLRLSEEDHKRTRYLTDAEEKRLLAALPTDADRAIVRIGLHSGLRQGNILALDWDRDVNLAARKLRGWSRKGRPRGRMKNKPLRTRWVPINDELFEVLRALPNYPATLRELREGERRWLFPNATGTGHLNPKNWYHRVWRPAVEDAEVKDFHFHDLRHTTATRLGLAGARTRDIATALGHADERTAQRYEHAHLADGHMLAVMQSLSRPRPETTDRGTDRGADRPKTGAPAARTATA